MHKPVFPSRFYLVQFFPAVATSSSSFSLKFFFIHISFSVFSLRNAAHKAVQSRCERFVACTAYKMKETKESTTTTTRTKEEVITNVRCAAYAYCS